MSAVVLALLAALLFAVAARVQQSAARAHIAARTPTGSAMTTWLPITGVLARLVRSRLWTLGWGVNAVGFVVQGIALHRGSIALVQPILVTQLLFTIPIAVIGTGRRPGPWVWGAGLSVCLGIVMFVDVWGTETLHAVDRSRVGYALAVAWALVAVLVLVGSRLRNTSRTALLSVAAGLCFSTTAVLLKMTVDPLIRQGLGTTLGDWPVYLLVVSTFMGLVIGQDALAHGSLPTVVAGTTITNPLASAAIGVLAFHERVPSHASTLIGLSCAGLLLTAGVIGLAMSPALRALEADRTRRFTPDLAQRGDAAPLPGSSMGCMIPTEQVRT
jgi:drug/metabolite transporter (DMT)-like permease